MSTNYNNPDLSGCDLWQMEASALDNTASYEIFPWPFEAIAALMMMSYKAEEAHSVASLKRGLEVVSTNVETDFEMSKEVFHEKV